MDALKHAPFTVPQFDTPRRAYRIWEVADSLGVGRSAVYGWIQDGKLKATKIGGITLVLVPDFDAFLSHCGDEVHERAAKGM